MDTKNIIELFYSDKLSDKERQAFVKVVLSVVPDSEKRKFLKDIIDTVSDDSINQVFNMLGTILASSEFGKGMLKGVGSDSTRKDSPESDPNKQ